ncbi:hypothetical protein ACFLTD_01295, partial [Elusimicrobiota bacterium]
KSVIEFIIELVLSDYDSIMELIRVQASDALGTDIYDDLLNKLGIDGQRKDIFKEIFIEKVIAESESAKEYFQKTGWYGILTQIDPEFILRKDDKLGVIVDIKSIVQSYPDLKDMVMSRMRKTHLLNKLEYAMDSRPGTVMVLIGNDGEVTGRLTSFYNVIDKERTLDSIEKEGDRREGRGTFLMDTLMDYLKREKFQYLYIGSEFPSIGFYHKYLTGKAWFSFAQNQYKVHVQTYGELNEDQIKYQRELLDKSIKSAIERTYVELDSAGIISRLYLDENVDLNDLRDALNRVIKTKSDMAGIETVEEWVNSDDFIDNSSGSLTTDILRILSESFVISIGDLVANGFNPPIKDIYLSDSIIEQESAVRDARKDEESDDEMEKMINNSADRMSKKEDIALNFGSEDAELWEEYIFDMIQRLSKSKKMAFLKALNVYLNNEIPSAELLKDCPVYLYEKISIMTVRDMLWTDESIRDAALILKDQIDEVKSKTGKPPVIIEVGAGYGDLSYGLKEILIADYPGIRVIPTDGLVEDPRSLPGSITGVYDPEIIKERGVIKMDIDDIATGAFRKHLNISDDRELILIGGLLARDAGVETDLLNQNEIGRMLIITSSIGGGKTSGDDYIFPNREVWDVKGSKPDEDTWYSGAVYSGPGVTPERLMISVKVYNRIKVSDVNLPGTLSQKGGGYSPVDYWDEETISFGQFLNILESYRGWALPLDSIRHLYEKVTFTRQQHEEFMQLLKELRDLASHPETKADFHEAVRYFSGIISEESFEANILKPLFKFARNPFYSILGAPAGEEFLFREWALSPEGWGIGFAVFGFSFAHIIFKWIARAKNRGKVESVFRAVFNKNELVKDLKQLAYLSVISTLLTILYNLTITGIPPIVMAFTGHALHNIVFRWFSSKGRIPEWAKDWAAEAAIITDSELEKEREQIRIAQKLIPGLKKQWEDKLKLISGLRHKASILKDPDAIRERERIKAEIEGIKNEIIGLVKSIKREGVPLIHGSYLIFIIKIKDLSNRLEILYKYFSRKDGHKDKYDFDGGHLTKLMALVKFSLNDIDEIIGGFGELGVMTGDQILQSLKKIKSMEEFRAYKKLQISYLEAIDNIRNTENEETRLDLIIELIEKLQKNKEVNREKIKEALSLITRDSEQLFRKYVDEVYRRTPDLAGKLELVRKNFKKTIIVQGMEEYKFNSSNFMLMMRFPRFNLKHIIEIIDKYEELGIFSGSVVSQAMRKYRNIETFRKYYRGLQDEISEASSYYDEKLPDIMKAKDEIKKIELIQDVISVLEKHRLKNLYKIGELLKLITRDEKSLITAKILRFIIKTDNISARLDVFRKYLNNKVNAGGDEMYQFSGWQLVRMMSHTKFSFEDIEYIRKRYEYVGIKSGGRVERAVAKYSTIENFEKNFIKDIKGDKLRSRAIINEISKLQKNKRKNREEIREYLTFIWRGGYRLFNDDQITEILKRGNISKQLKKVYRFYDNKIYANGKSQYQFNGAQFTVMTKYERFDIEEIDYIIRRLGELGRNRGSTVIDSMVKSKSMQDFDNYIDTIYNDIDRDKSEKDLVNRTASEIRVMSGGQESLEVLIDMIDTVKSRKRRALLVSLISRDGKKIFSKELVDIIISYRSKTSEILKILKEIIYLKQGNLKTGPYLFTPSQLASISTRGRDRYRVLYLIDYLTGKGIRKGSHISYIVNSTKSIADIHNFIEYFILNNILDWYRISTLIRSPFNLEDIKLLRSIKVDMEEGEVTLEGHPEIEFTIREVYGPDGMSVVMNNLVENGLVSYSSYLLNFSLAITEDVKSKLVWVILDPRQYSLMSSISAKRGETDLTLEGTIDSGIDYEEDVILPYIEISHYMPKIKKLIGEKRFKKLIKYAENEDDLTLMQEREYSALISLTRKKLMESGELIKPALKPEESFEANILKPLFKFARNPFYSILGAPAAEEFLFREWALSPEGWGIGFAVFGFSFAHIIFKWIARAKNRGKGENIFRAVFDKDELIKDLKQLAYLSVISTLLTILYNLTITGIPPIVMAFTGHALHNIVFRWFSSKGRIPEWAKDWAAEAVIGKEDKSAEDVSVSSYEEFIKKIAELEIDKSKKIYSEITLSEDEYLNSLDTMEELMMDVIKDRDLRQEYKHLRERMFKDLLIREFPVAYDDELGTIVDLTEAYKKYGLKYFSNISTEIQVKLPGLSISRIGMDNLYYNILIDENGNVTGGDSFFLYVNGDNIPEAEEMYIQTIKAGAKRTGGELKRGTFLRETLLDMLYKGGYEVFTIKTKERGVGFHENFLKVRVQYDQKGMEFKVYPQTLKQFAAYKAKFDKEEPVKIGKKLTGKNLIKLKKGESLEKAEREIDEEIRSSIKRGLAVGLKPGITHEDIDRMFVYTEKDGVKEIDPQDTATNLLKALIWDNESLGGLMNYLEKEFDGNSAEVLKENLKKLATAYQASVADPLIKDSENRLDSRRIMVLLRVRSGPVYHMETTRFEEGKVLAHSGTNTVYLHINTLKQVKTPEDMLGLRYILEHEAGDLVRGHHEKDIDPAAFEKYVRPLWKKVSSKISPEPVSERFATLKYIKKLPGNLRESISAVINAMIDVDPASKIYILPLLSAIGIMVGIIYSMKSDYDIFSFAGLLTVLISWVSFFAAPILIVVFFGIAYSIASDIVSLFAPLKKYFKNMKNEVEALFWATLIVGGAIFGFNYLLNRIFDIELGWIVNILSFIGINILLEATLGSKGRILLSTLKKIFRIKPVERVEEDIRYLKEELVRKLEAHRFSRIKADPYIVSVTDITRLMYGNTSDEIIYELERDTNRGSAIIMEGRSAGTLEDIAGVIDGWTDKDITFFNKSGDKETIKFADINFGENDGIQLYKVWSAEDEQEIIPEKLLEKHINGKTVMENYRKTLSELNKVLSELFDPERPRRYATDFIMSIETPAIRNAVVDMILDPRLREYLYRASFVGHLERLIPRSVHKEPSVREKYIEYLKGMDFADLVMKLWNTDGIDKNNLLNVLDTILEAIQSEDIKDKYKQAAGKMRESINSTDLYKRMDTEQTRPELSELNGIFIDIDMFLKYGLKIPPITGEKPAGDLRSELESKEGVDLIKALYENENIDREQLGNALVMDIKMKVNGYIATAGSMVATGHLIDARNSFIRWVESKGFIKDTNINDSALADLNKIFSEGKIPNTTIGSLESHGLIVPAAEKGVALQPDTNKFEDEKSFGVIRKLWESHKIDKKNLREAFNAYFDKKLNEFYETGPDFEFKKQMRDSYSSFRSWVNNDRFLQDNKIPDSVAFGMITFVEELDRLFNDNVIQGLVDKGLELPVKPVTDPVVEIIDGLKELYTSGAGDFLGAEYILERAENNGAKTGLVYKTIARLYTLSKKNEKDLDLDRFIRLMVNIFAAETVYGNVLTRLNELMGMPFAERLISVSNLMRLKSGDLRIHLTIDGLIKLINAAETSDAKEYIEPGFLINIADSTGDEFYEVLKSLSELVVDPEIKEFLDPETLKLVALYSGEHTADYIGKITELLTKGDDTQRSYLRSFVTPQVLVNYAMISKNTQVSAYEVAQWLSDYIAERTRAYVENKADMPDKPLEDIVQQVSENESEQRIYQLYMEKGSQIMEEIARLTSLINESDEPAKVFDIILAYKSNILNSSHPELFDIDLISAVINPHIQQELSNYMEVFDLLEKLSDIKNLTGFIDVEFLKHIAIHAKDKVDEVIEQLIEWDRVPNKEQIKPFLDLDFLKTVIKSAGTESGDALGSLLTLKRYHRTVRGELIANNTAFLSKIAIHSKGKTYSAFQKINTLLEAVWLHDLITPEILSGKDIVPDKFRVNISGVKHVRAILDHNDPARMAFIEGKEFLSALRHMFEVIAEENGENTGKVYAGVKRILDLEIADKIWINTDFIERLARASKENTFDSISSIISLHQSPASEDVLREDILTEIMGIAGKDTGAAYAILDILSGNKQLYGKKIVGDIEDLYGLFRAIRDSGLEKPGELYSEILKFYKAMATLHEDLPNGVPGYSVDLNFLSGIINITGKRVGLAFNAYLNLITEDKESIKELFMAVIDELSDKEVVVIKKDPAASMASSTLSLACIAICLR